MMNYFWKPYRATYYLIRQAGVGDQSFWKESKKLLSLAAIKKDRRRAAVSKDGNT